MKSKMLAIAMLALSTLLWAGDNVGVNSSASTGRTVHHTTVALPPTLGSTEAISVPLMLSYQGRLTDTVGQPVADTTYSVTFRLYTVPSGGSAFWNETQTVRTKGGLFSMLLGSVSPIESVPSAGNLYLGMQVGASELAPRLRIVSGAYSYLSHRADTANYAVSGGTPENAWTRGSPDSVLFTTHCVGVARGGAGNNLYGNYRYTHVNLGNSSTTGINGQNNDFATVAGGFGGIAGGPCATVGGGHSDTAGAYAATIAGGYGNHAAGTFSTVGGGQANAAAASFSTVVGGSSNSAESSYAAIGGGQNNDATASYSTVPGGYAARTSHYGELAHANGYFANHGDAQASEYVLRAEGAGDVTLTLDGASPGSSNGLRVAQNRDVVYDVLVVTNANSQAAGFHIQCVVKDVGGSTYLVGSPSATTIASDNPGFSVWAWVENNALWVGAHSDQTARWVATVRTAELNW